MCGGLADGKGVMGPEEEEDALLLSLTAAFREVLSCIIAARSRKVEGGSSSHAYHEAVRRHVLVPAL